MYVVLESFPPDTTSLLMDAVEVSVGGTAELLIFFGGGFGIMSAGRDATSNFLLFLVCRFLAFLISGVALREDESLSGATMLAYVWLMPCMTLTLRLWFMKDVDGLDWW